MSKPSTTRRIWLPPPTTTLAGGESNDDAAADEAQQPDHVVNALCLGTGRFLRSVLVPSLVGAGMRPALIQLRGRSFLEYMMAKEGETEEGCHYPVDTVERDGTVTTDHTPCWGAFSMGSNDDKTALFDWLRSLKTPCISVLGVGVTEAGLASADTQAMQNTFDLLQELLSLLLSLLLQRDGRMDCRRKLCVICTDNVANNGDVIRGFMQEIATRKNDKIMEQFLNDHVVFLNSMVDRITSQRDGSNGMVPRCEPTPMKALVLLDPDNDIPPALAQQRGVVVRRTKLQLDADVALKLRIVNGTHTAIAHFLALLGYTSTTALSRDESGGQLFIKYLSSLVADQIIPTTTDLNATTEKESLDVWNDWKERLLHPHFGLSTFFITQNGSVKGGIRWGDSMRALLMREPKKGGEGPNISISFAFAYAVLLRWLTPQNGSASSSHDETVFLGWLDHHSAPDSSYSNNTEHGKVAYADGLSYDTEEGWYEFKCDLSIKDVTGNNVILLPQLLHQCHGKQPSGCVEAVRQYLVSDQGGRLGSVASIPFFNTFVGAIATMYARLLAGDSLSAMLGEMNDLGFNSSCQVLVDGQSSSHPLTFSRLRSGVPLQYCPSPIPNESCLMGLPISPECVPATVLSEVAAAEVIDLHTHILPPTHGSLYLWGIDELLTYHYLVAEYFITAASSVTPESFYELSKQQQAELIWQALFIDRSPVSEACRGVITTMQSLGLSKEIRERDLQSIRIFYRKYQQQGEQGSVAFCEEIFRISGVRYAIMTNIPFSQAEAQYWRGPNQQPYSPRFRSALRVDPLLAGDSKTVEAALKSSGYESSLEGARQYLRDWVDTMKPEYMMASTPHDFVFEEGSLAGFANRSSVNTEAMYEPFAFAKAPATACIGTEDDAPSVVNEQSDFLGEVLMKVCEERDLPVALKIGAHRGVNPRLRDAGDGVVAFADAGMLGRLCTKFPKVRFLATFLSRSNQHEAVVLATKFRNLHLYGCWWFCNNPSIIQEITSMRLEMLGTAFTAQHSDARVVDQLLYKWPHSRGVIAAVLAEQYEKLALSGWTITRRELRRDVQRLFGKSYEEFMAKSFV